MRFLQLIWLKWKSLASRPFSLLLFCLLPLVLTIPAGLVHKNNDYNHLRPAIVNLSDTVESEQLLEWLLEGELNWRVTSQKTGAQELYNGTIDVLLFIPEDFSIPDKPEVRLAKGSRAEAVGIIIEEASTAIVPLIVREEMIRSLAEQKSVPEDNQEVLGEKFFTESRLMEDKVPIRMTTEGVDINVLEENRLLWLPRYNIELLFLSLFAVLGSMGFRERGRKQKLLSIEKAFFIEGYTSLIALAILGLIQILLLHGGLYLILPELDTDPYIILILFTFLLTQLAAAQCFVLLHEDQRLLTALLTLCFSAALGSCFFTLPSGFMHKIGYFTPHGWAMGALERVPLLSPLLVGLISLVVFSIALFSQSSQNRL